MELAELEAALEARGHPRFHARQIFPWIYARGVTDFEMTDRPELRARFGRFHFRISTPDVIGKDISSDGTVKFLLALDDNRRIESVFIPDTPSQTFCISTQVGCAMKCGFCLTGKMGLVRNLTAGEIAGQVRVLANELGLRDSKFNIVLMGMGEPLHNYDNTMKALRMLNDEHGLAVSPKRVTLSTVGIVPALDRLATEPLMPNLAISLHATTEDAARRARAANGSTASRTSWSRAQVPRSAPKPYHLRDCAARRGQRHGGRRAAARSLLSGIKAKVNLIAEPGARHSLYKEGAGFGGILHLGTIPICERASSG